MASLWKNPGFYVVRGLAAGRVKLGAMILTSGFKESTQ
jgi:hypothetical protein